MVSYPNFNFGFSLLHRIFFTQHSVPVTTDDGVLLRLPLMLALLRVPLSPREHLSSDELGDEATSCNISCICMFFSGVM